MKQVCQKIVLDSCVVIDLIEKRSFLERLRASLKGKQVHIVLCDVMFGEVFRVKGHSSEQIISKVSKLGKKVTVFSVDDTHRIHADSLTAQYQVCHNGDNLIVALCQTEEFILLTFDKMLLKTCGFVGVVAFHPARAGGI